MTKKQLQELRHFDAELLDLKRHLAELEESVGISSMTSDGQPRGTKIGRPTEQQALRIYEMIEKIRQLETRIVAAKLAAWDLVENLDDPMLRRIIIYRFVDGMSWLKVSESIGGDATADGCRMYFARANIDD